MLLSSRFLPKTVLVQLTLSAEHYAYVAPAMGAGFDARVATPARDVKVTPTSDGVSTAACGA